MPPSEHLVIVTGKEPEQIFMRLSRQLTVTQRVSSRVFLVSGAQPVVNVPEPEGVHIFSTEEVPAEILNSLDEKESLFVSAWQTRLQQSRKQRPGEGLDWDHPGFKPPR